MYTTYRLHSLSSVFCCWMFRTGETVIGFGLGCTAARHIAQSLARSLDRCRIRILCTLLSLANFAAHAVFIDSKWKQMQRTTEYKTKKEAEKFTRCCTQTIKQRTDSMFEQTYMHKLVPFVCNAILLSLSQFVFLLFFFAIYPFLSFHSG